MLGPVSIGIANGTHAHIACRRIKTVSKVPNKRRRLHAYVHALTLPVERTWLLQQPNPSTLRQISIDLYTAGAVNKILCSGGYGPSLSLLRVSADAHAS